MRLSEAIMLGAATCKMEPGNLDSCALGAAANAVGIPVDVKGWRFWLSATNRLTEIDKRWPWIGIRGYFRIVGRFDNKVCAGEMTLEQLVDYVRSIEPDCDCNRFNCDCKAKQETVAEVEHAHQT